MLKVADEFFLIGLHLIENLRVRFRDGIGCGLFRLRAFRGRQWYRPTSQLLGKLGRVIGPGGENLCALVQVVGPDFVESVGLAVMRFRIFGAILYAIETGNAHVIKRTMVAAERAVPTP